MKKIVDLFWLKTHIIKKIMELGHWWRNFRLKSGRKSRWISFKKLKETGKWKTEVDTGEAVTQLKHAFQTAAEQISTDEISSSVEQ